MNSTLVSNLENTYRSIYHIKNVYHAMSLYPNMPWQDIFSKSQLLSKIWLIDELKKITKNLGCVYVCAGWVGLLESILLNDNSFIIDKIRSFDIDGACADVADTLNRDPWVLNNWKFKATEMDICNINYYEHTYNTKRKNGTVTTLSETPDTIINTACDHITRYEYWYSLLPSNKLLILQNNDSYDLDSTHTNTVKSLDHMISLTPMQTILYKGVLPLEKFNRFMLIGYK